MSVGQLTSAFHCYILQFTFTIVKTIIDIAVTDTGSSRGQKCNGLMALDNVLTTQYCPELCNSGKVLDTILDVQRTAFNTSILSPLLNVLCEVSTCLHTVRTSCCSSCETFFLGTLFQPAQAEQLLCTVLSCSACAG